MVCFGVSVTFKILGSLSANGWCCVVVLLVVWNRVSSAVVCWSLSGAGSSIVMEVSGKAFAICYYMELGVLWWTKVLTLPLQPQRQRPDTGQSTKTLSATWLRRKGRKKERTNERKKERKKRKEKKRKSYKIKNIKNLKIKK